MIQIDGSQGEGGGQMLRSALALSIATRRPFRMVNIRAGRAKPGLMRQHLTCVQAAATISGTEVTGAEVGSREITFAPGAPRAGTYHFPIGTAGGTTLVLQAVLPALLRADGISTITVEGGTHNTGAPTFDFFARSLLPLLHRAGATVRAELGRHGFYPAGGGRVVVHVEPITAPEPLRLLERGERTRVLATAYVSRLPIAIALRETDVLRDRLAIDSGDTQAVAVQNPVGPGNAAVVELRYQHITEVFSAIGEISKSAEAVARGLADEVRDYITARHPVGPHLADQLMVPLTVLAGGEYATGALTEHARTNIAVIEQFGGRVEVLPDGVVRVQPLV